MLRTTGRSALAFRTRRRRRNEFKMAAGGPFRGRRAHPLIASAHLYSGVFYFVCCTEQRTALTCLCIPFRRTLNCSHKQGARNPTRDGARNFRIWAFSPVTLYIHFNKNLTKGFPLGFSLIRRQNDPSKVRKTN